jgi:hypothetical protein
LGGDRVVAGISMRAVAVQQATRIRRELLEGREVSVVYDDPWFWQLRPGRSATAVSDDGDEGGRFDAARAEQARLEATIRSEAHRRRKYTPL